MKNTGKNRVIANIGAVILFKTPFYLLYTLTYCFVLCVFRLPGNSKERSLKLFPINNPKQWDKTAFPAMTREIFAEAIGNLITIYLWMCGTA
jgi:hypothetical protein